jgi:hypothetical protein
MATNGILDITTEEYMGQDPEMQIDQDEMIEIIRTLQVIGIPQDKHPEVLEAFKEWKQTNAGTVDMFLEASLQLEPGTITKIKEQQVARGPQDMQTEDEMIIQPGSGDMQEIMQSVGAPQRAANGGLMASAPDMGEGPFMLEEFLQAVKDGFKGSYDEYIDQVDRSPADYMARGGRIGYQTGEQVLPMPRPDPDADPRAAFFRRMGAMPDQTLLRQPQSMNAMSGHMRGQGIMGQTQDPFGGLLGGEEGDIGMGGQPLVEYEHEGAEQPPSWWDRMRTGTTGTPLENEVSPMGQGLDITIEMVMDLLRKLGWENTEENRKKIWEALLAAAKFGTPMGQVAGLGIAGLKSLGAPEEIEETETETIGFRDGGITNAVPRQGFFIGKAVKAITGGAKKVLKSAKKVLKSDLGKMAMMYLATAGFSNLAAQQGMGGAQKWFGKGGWKWLQPSNVASNIGSSIGRLTDKLGWDKVVKPNELQRWTDANKLAEIKKWGSFENPTNWQQYKFDEALKALKPVKEAAPFYKSALPWIGGASVLGGLYTQQNPGDVQFDMDKRGEEVDDVTKWLAQIPPADDIVYPYPNYTGAQGGRVGRQEGGIMDLGGAEKDYRNTGGFVDIGAQEKADDVPARLSVNEFVMTADAVRGAGDGDVEEGAERLQDTMKQLEQKGKRHKAAQGMFATSQRLGEVI